jgi:hypothetical protein
MEQALNTTTVDRPAPRISSRLPRIIASGRFLRPAATVLAGAALAAAAWASLRLVPQPVAIDGLVALIGAGALLYLGFAALSIRDAAGLGNLVAFGGILAWALFAPVAPWAMATGLLLHAAACGFNAWQAGRAVASGRDLPLTLTCGGLILAMLILTAGL